MGLLDWWQDRQRSKEIERDMQARRGKAQIRRHINNQKKMAAKLWEMGKRALQLGDQRQFASIGKQYLWTHEDVKRWERYLLAFESVEARRDQVRSTAEFMSGIQAMTKSVLAGASPKAIAETEKELQTALARAQNLEQMLDYMMETTDQTVFAFEELADKDVDESFRDLQHEMEREIGSEKERAVAGTAADARIAEGLRQIELEMRKDLNR